MEKNITSESTVQKEVHTNQNQKQQGSKVKKGISFESETFDLLELYAECVELDRSAAVSTRAFMMVQNRLASNMFG